MSFVCSTGATSFPTARNGHDVEKLIEKENVDKNTWIVFDIYHTLAQSQHPATHVENMRIYRGWLKESLKKLSKKQMEFALNSSIEHENGLLLTDKAFPELIAALRKKGVCMWALTTSLAHQFKDIKSLKDWTADTFKGLKISFEGTAPKVRQSTLTSRKKPEHPATFYKGFVFTNGEYGLTKGEALVLMLKSSSTQPKRIFMVDDKEKNLISIEKELKKTNPSIRFVGILFKANSLSTKPLSKKDFMTFWERHFQEARAL